MQNRDTQGRYSANKWMVRICYAIIVLALGMIVAHYTFVQAELDNQVHAELPKIIPVAHAEEIKPVADVSAIKTKLVEDMVQCENPSHVPAIHDDNKAGTLPLKDKISYGDLQMKISTIQNFYFQLHNEHLSDLDAVLLALDPQKARDFALDTWIQVKGSINQWSCATEAMKTRVEDIRLLTK